MVAIAVMIVAITFEDLVVAARAKTGVAVVAISSVAEIVVMIIHADLLPVILCQTFEDV